MHIAIKRYRQKCLNALTVFVKFTVFHCLFSFSIKHSIVFRWLSIMSNRRKKHSLLTPMHILLLLHPLTFILLPNLLPCMASSFIFASFRCGFILVIIRLTSSPLHLFHCQLPLCKFLLWIHLYAPTICLPYTDLHPLLIRLLQTYVEPYEV